MSQLKSETARLNGAKSRGPVTAQGKSNSSRNAIRHGLCSDLVVLPHEDKAAFEELRQSYLDRFRPADHLESGLIEKMANATWRLNRLTGIETKTLEEQLLLTAKKMALQLLETTPEEQLAWVFDHVANNSTTLTLLLRYRSSYNREFDKSLKQLQDLQKQRRAQQQPEMRSEPKNPVPAPHSRSFASIRGPEKEPQTPANTLHSPETTPEPAM